MTGLTWHWPLSRSFRSFYPFSSHSNDISFSFFVCFFSLSPSLFSSPRVTSSNFSNRPTFPLFEMEISSSLSSLVRVKKKKDFSIRTCRFEFRCFCAFVLSTNRQTFYFAKVFRADVTSDKFTKCTKRKYGGYVFFLFFWKRRSERKNAYRQSIWLCTLILKLSSFKTIVFETRLRGMNMFMTRDSIYVFLEKKSSNFDEKLLVLIIRVVLVYKYCLKYYIYMYINTSIVMKLHVTL